MERLPLTAGDIAAVTGGRLMQGDAGKAIERISIDSRKLGAGDFFVAIRGERFDGHQFVGDVLARGASGVLLDTLPGELASRRDGAANAPVLIRAKDTTVALQPLFVAGYACSSSAAIRFMSASTCPKGTSCLTRPIAPHQ